jgi:CheY-like chemotaxis protein
MDRKKILIADDDYDNFVLAMDAMKEAGLECDLCWVKDGEEVLDYLYHRPPHEDPVHAPFPDLILLDLNMPKKNGHEALKEIKADPALAGIPVVVLTVSRANEDRNRSYALGANAFISKPHNFDRLVDSMRELKKYL